MLLKCKQKKESDLSERWYKAELPLTLNQEQSEETWKYHFFSHVAKYNLTSRLSGCCHSKINKQLLANCQNSYHWFTFDKGYVLLTFQKSCFNYCIKTAAEVSLFTLWYWVAWQTVPIRGFICIFPSLTGTSLPEILSFLQGVHTVSKQMWKTRQNLGYLCDSSRIMGKSKELLYIPRVEQQILHIHFTPNNI